MDCGTGCSTSEVKDQKSEDIHCRLLIALKCAVLHAGTGAAWLQDNKPVAQALGVLNPVKR